MKRSYIFFTILLLMTLSASAQQNPIIGTWQLDLAQTIGLMESSTKQKFDNLDQNVRTRMEVSMSGRVFSFASNGNVTINWQAQGNAITSSGTWHLTGETLSLTMDGDVQQFTYELTAGSHLTLHNTTPSGLFSNLYLTWQP